MIKMNGIEIKKIFHEAVEAEVLNVEKFLPNLNRASTGKIVVREGKNTPPAQYVYDVAQGAENVLYDDEEEIEQNCLWEIVEVIYQDERLTKTRTIAKITFDYDHNMNLVLFPKCEVVESSVFDVTDRNWDVRLKELNGVFFTEKAPYVWNNIDEAVEYLAR